jgi:4-amino-4-deoxy-L-arabinose transferase-like glycosyltransferase
LDAELEYDEIVFTGIAWNLVSGNGFSLNGEVPTARRPPVYPLLLAGIFSVFGRSWVAARVVNILISCLTVGMIYLTSCRLFNKDIALFSSLTGVFYPSLIRNSMIVYSDTLFCFIVSLILFVFTRIQSQPESARNKVLAGALLGIGILTRSELVLFIPFLFIWALFFHRQFRKALGTFALLLLPILLLVLPWLVRNYIAFDGFTMASNLGRVMWGVHNPDTFTDLKLMGKWVPPDVVFRNAGEYPSDLRDPAYQYLPEREWDRQLVKLALESIAQNMRSLPRMELYKLHRLVFSDGAIRNLFRFPFLYSFVFGLTLLLASENKRPFLIFYTLIVFSIFSTLVFYTNERLRLFIDPAFIIISTYGVFEQIRIIKEFRVNPTFQSITNEIKA